MSKEQKYTTQLSAGLGLIEETKQLLELWQPGMRTTELLQTALNSGYFPTVTARRLRNIVAECFVPRLARNSHAAEYLKVLVPALRTSELPLFLLLYTTRSNLMLADFIKQVYWEKYATGHSVIDAADAREFVQNGIHEGNTQSEWSETTIKRQASYLLGCCVDYGLLTAESRVLRRIAAPRISDNLIVYLAHELHFSGLGDNAVIQHPDWQLFGLQPNDVREELKRLALKKLWIVQSAASVVQISWRYKTMEEVIDVIAKKQL